MDTSLRFGFIVTHSGNRLVDLHKNAKHLLLLFYIVMAKRVVK